MANASPFYTDTPTKILIAEDDQSSQVMFRYMLEAEYAVTVVSDGEQALQAMTTDHYDLMLLDLLMPRLDGFGVLQELRPHYHKDKFPVIVVSALEDGESVVRALHLGANDYITKPIDMGVLLTRIATQLGLSRLINQQQQTITSMAMTHEVQQRLCRIITHDLQSPLSNFRMAHFLLRGFVAENEEAQRVIDNMEITLNAIVDMIRVFVEAIDSQELRPTFAAVNVARLVGDVVVQHRLSAERKDIRLVAETIDGMIWGDQRMLSQALSNLLSNALKFSPAGTKTHVWVEKVGNRYRLNVHDQGPGIPEDERANLFIMFNKLRNRPTGGESSSGLGLWIVRQLVDLHHGDCGEYTPESGGSVFWMEIPMATPEQIAEQKANKVTDLTTTHSPGKR